VVQHVHDGGEEHTLIGLAGASTDHLGEERFSDTGITDEHDAGALVKELQIEQTDDPIFCLHPALVMFEEEAVDGVLSVQSLHAEAAFDGTAVPGVQFEIGERFQGLREAQILTRRVGDRLIELVARRRQLKGLLAIRAAAWLENHFLRVLFGLQS
jgi:hypothetical protein